MSLCPKCDAEIGSSSGCGCGWKRPGQQAAPAPIVPCTNRDCLTPATVRVKAPFGWATSCGKHYDDYHQTQADEACARLGLNTIEEKRAYVRAKMKALAAKWRAIPARDEEHSA